MLFQLRPLCFERWSPSWTHTLHPILPQGRPHFMADFWATWSLLSNHLCPAFHLSVWTHWFRNTSPFSGFSLFWVPFNLSWLPSFLLFGMFSLLSIQIHHVLVDAPDATSRNLLPIPLRLCPNKLLHKHYRMLFHTKSQNTVPCLLECLFVCVCWLYHTNIQRHYGGVCFSEFCV